MNMRRFIHWVVPLVAILLLVSAAHACPMCKDSIPNSDAQHAGSLPSGFNNSVYFVLVGFLTVLGTVITLIVRTIRQSTTHVRPGGFRVIEP